MAYILAIRNPMDGEVTFRGPFPTKAAAEASGEQLWDRLEWTAEPLEPDPDTIPD